MMKRRAFKAAALFCLSGLLIAGCKTQDDAVAAAAQMAETAKTMSAYYGALDAVLTRTEDARAAQHALLGTAYADLTSTHAKVRQRAEFADDLCALAAAFTHLTGSTAAADASTAAGKLNAEVVTLAALTANDTETSVLKSAVKTVVELIQAHQEIKAAKAMSTLTAATAKFFDDETPVYNSLDEAYLLAAQTVAHELVRANQVDFSGPYVSALKTFDLKSPADTTGLQKNLHDYYDAGIDKKFDAQLRQGNKATADLSAALHEMDARVQTLAADKAMSLRSLPLTLKDVQSWIADMTK